MCFKARLYKHTTLYQENTTNRLNCLTSGIIHGISLENIALLDEYMYVFSCSSWKGQRMQDIMNWSATYELCNYALKWYTMEYLGQRIPMSHLCFWGPCVYQENTSDKWDIPQLYHKKGWHNYFIPCQKIQWPNEKVGCGTLELHWLMEQFGRILTNIQRLSCILIGCIFCGMV